MIYKEFPTDKDILECEDYWMCCFSEHNDCRYVDRCEMLHCNRLSKELEKILVKEESNE